MDSFKAFTVEYNAQGADPCDIERGNLKYNNDGGIISSFMLDSLSPVSLYHCTSVLLICFTRYLLILTMNVWISLGWCVKAFHRRFQKLEKKSATIHEKSLDVVREK